MLGISVRQKLESREDSGALCLMGGVLFANLVAGKQGCSWTTVPKSWPKSWPDRKQSAKNIAYTTVVVQTTLPSPNDLLLKTLNHSIPGVFSSYTWKGNGSGTEESRPTAPAHPTD